MANRPQPLADLFAGHPDGCACHTWSSASPLTRHLLPVPTVGPHPDHEWRRCGRVYSCPYPLGEACPPCRGLGWVEVRWYLAYPAPGGPIRFGVPRKDEA